MYDLDTMNDLPEETGAETTDLGDLWDEEDGGEYQPTEEPAGETEQTSEETQAEGEPTPQVGQEKEGEGADQPQEQTSHEDRPETFELNYMGQMRTVSREEMTALAQQGLDYGRIRTERDELRTYRESVDPAYQLIREFAEASGMTVEAYIDYCRTQELMGQGVDETTARAQVELSKREAAIRAQEQAGQESQRRAQAAQQAQQERAQAQRRDMEAFLDAYPEVKPEDIPREVFERVKAGESLVSAYTQYENRQLKAKMAAQTQNEQNAAKAPGSMKSQGQSGKKTIDDYWDEAGE